MAGEVSRHLWNNFSRNIKPTFGKTGKHRIVGTIFVDTIRNTSSQGGALTLGYNPVPLWTIVGLKYDLENELSVPVDVIHAPPPQGTIIKIGKTIPVNE